MMFLRGPKSWFLVLLLRLHCTAQSCMKGETAKRCMEGEMTLRCMEGDAAMHCMQRETAKRCMKREKAMDCMEEHERMMETQDENTVLRLPEPPKINDNIHSNRLPQRFLSWSSPLFYKELPRNLTTPKMENNHLCLHYQTCSFVNGRFKLRQYNTSRIRITLKCPLKIAVRPVVNLTCIKQHRIRAGLCGCCDKNGYGAWSFAVKPTSGLLSSVSRGLINASGEIGDVCNTVPELNVTCNISDTARLICTWPSAVQASTSNVASKLMYRWKTRENKLWEECKEYIQETGFEISGCVWHNVLYPNKLKLDVQIPHFLPYHETFKLETKYKPEPPSQLWLELKAGKPDDVCGSSNNMVEVDFPAERKHKRESDIGGTMKAEAEDREVAILCWKPPVLPNGDYVYDVNITPKDGGNKQSFRKRDGVGVWIKPFNPRRSYILSVRRKRQQLNDWSAWFSIEYNVVNDAGQKWWWQKLILAALALIILCGLFILTIHVSRHKLLRLKTKLWPDIPDPSHLLNHFSTLIGTETRAHDHLGSELASTKSELTHFIEELKENVLTNTHPSLKAPLQNELIEPYVPEQDREEKAPDVLGETDKKPITIDLPSSVCLKAGNLQYCLLESMYVDTQGETILTCFGKNTDNIVTRLIPIEPT